MTLHEQSRFPLATLVLCAFARARAQRVRLLACAAREASARMVDHGIPGIL